MKKRPPPPPPRAGGGRPPRAKTARPRARTSAPEILGQVSTEPVPMQDMIHDALPPADPIDRAEIEDEDVADEDVEDEELETLEPVEPALARTVAAPAPVRHVPPARLPPLGGALAAPSRSPLAAPSQAAAASPRPAAAPISPRSAAQRPAAAPPDAAAPHAASPHAASPPPSPHAASPPPYAASPPPSPHAASPPPYAASPYAASPHAASPHAASPHAAAPPPHAASPSPHTASLPPHAASPSRSASPSSPPPPVTGASAGAAALPQVEASFSTLPPLPPLRVAVWESHGHLASARDAVTAAGHLVAGSGAGTEGLGAIQALLREGELDVLIVALPPVPPGASLLGGAPGDAAGSLIDAALALEPRRPVILAAVAGGLALGARRSAAAGADLVIARPHDVDKLAPALLAAARLGAERRLVTAARGAEAALRARLEQVAHTEAGGLEPFELFQRALELEIKRARRYQYPLAVAMFAVEIAPPPPPTGVRGILRARVGTALLRAIRDIDLATQLDHERFLVLLPYTDLSGAATVGKRVLAAVAAGDAVSAGGRTFPLRVVGAVAGAQPGQPLSFSRLMRDATRALEQARRDGAELAVQP